MFWCVRLSRSIRYLFSAVVSIRLFVRINSICIWTCIGWLPEMTLALFRFFGCFSSLMAINLSCNGQIPFWSILCPIHSISILKTSDLLSLSLYPAFSSLDNTSMSSFLCSFEPFVTTMMSSSHA